MFIDFAAMSRDKMPPLRELLRSQIRPMPVRNFRFLFVYEIRSERLPQGRILRASDAFLMYARNRGIADGYAFCSPNSGHGKEWFPRFRAF
jgi:hypothetical protein